MVNAFQRSTVDRARKSPIDGRFIRILYLRSGMLSEGSAFSLLKTPACYQTWRKRQHPGFWADGGSPPIAADILASEGRGAEGYLLGPRVPPLTYLK